MKSAWFGSIFWVLILPKQTFSLGCLVRWVAFWVAAKGIYIEWWQQWCWSNLGEINNRSSSSTCHIYILYHDGRFNQQPWITYHISSTERWRRRRIHQMLRRWGGQWGLALLKTLQWVSRLFTMISGRDGSSYQYEIVHKAADIMCTCQYCGCNMCPMVARGGNINMVQTMWNNNVSCDQEVASSTDIEYIRPIQGTHYFFFLFLLRHLQKSRIGNFSAFPNLTGWLASDIYWKVEWAKNKIGGKLAEQAGWHRVRDNSRPNGELQVPCQGKTGLALKVEAARTNKWSSWSPKWAIQELLMNWVWCTVNVHDQGFRERYFP